jgi:hypothetical protein
MLSWHLIDTFLAVVPKNQDVIAQIQAFWNDLITTGKLAAAGIGLVVGFLLKSIVS